MSEKSDALKDYFLKRLGFDIKNEFFENYINELELKWQYPSGDGRIFSGLIDFLKGEIYLKGTPGAFKEKINNSNNISATDLSNYKYCPVAYSIGKTFEIPKSVEAKTGTEFHESQKLINLIDNSSNFIESTNSLQNADNKPFFSDIYKSKLVYSGHSNIEKTQKFFINSSNDFIGQPDYVFENINGENFIVEEKFKKDINENKFSFFDNHKIQLESYIYFLNQFNAKYGYLVYWIYSMDNFSMRCRVLKINREEKTPQDLQHTFEQVKKFKSEAIFKINKELLNPKKCANCAYSLCCGHKNQRLDEVKLPYLRDYHYLYPSQYPELLTNYYLLLIEFDRKGFIVNRFNSLKSAENAKGKIIQNLQNNSQDIIKLKNAFKNHRTYDIDKKFPITPEPGTNDYIIKQ